MKKAAFDWARTAGWFWVTAVVGLTVPQRTGAATNVVLWDTGARFAGTVNVDNRSAWKVVPAELFGFEPDPVKAASDPGYYGREYQFKGDAVVENSRLLAVFWSAQGRVVVYAKPGAAFPGGATEVHAPLGNAVFAFALRQTGPSPAAIGRCEILRNGGDEVVLEIFCGADGSGSGSAVCAFDKTEIMAVQPGAGVPGIRLFCSLEYGVVPGFVGDDLILGSAEYGSAETLHLPAENVFVGLLSGEESELVMTWPKGNQHLELHPGQSATDTAVRASIDFDNDEQELWLAVLRAPGIWHREALTPAFLEKDVALAWRRPFAAKWKTQLTEAGVRTTFAFRESKGPVWRGVAGSYDYPVWFDGEQAFYHLGKKVPPRGESILYFLEGEDTPPAFSTPVDVMKTTLGRQLSDTLRDVAGRKLRTHHRRGDENVRRACTCGCTEAIQAVFQAGQEVERRDAVEEALADMNFFVRRHLERIGEYREFAGDLIPFLQSEAGAAPELKPFCDQLVELVQRIPQEYDVQRENLKSLEHAGELTRRTMALTTRQRADNLRAYMELFDAWRAMGGAQDYVLAQCHTIARELFQKAGYGGVGNPKAMALARQIRARCRQVLRNPDGYEIWADY